ncbi:MAG: MAPEG family protein [Kordiimonadaceae bacterium]|jgi:glutathione S-transferase|nr:MAPEG family protein [Kordiimonadaceae bacterium]MBT6036917.1 MAPEG family protein [Kordiimonadaceae bacterium]MBT6330141.1 MAPEG family protein [Kordiimonadaceae bacterium]MBT7583057.1 MAPEG family protein [Kordiimonadaceae bacterium]
MELVAIVIGVALLEYSYFGLLVGKARGQYGIDAPATSGDPIFERYHRVQQNTLEQLILVIPGMVMFAYYVRADAAAALGAVYVIGRLIYLKSYVADPKKRSMGFALSWLPSVILVIGGLVGAVMKIM